MNFENKVVVVTGASSGIGEALAHRFAALGAHVVAGARSIDKLQKVVESLPTLSLAVACDVSREEDCKKLIQRAVEAFGHIDVLVNNAGISMRALFDDVDLSVLHRLMDTNFWGAVYCTKYALPYIQKSQGSIVGISSVAGFHGLPGRTGYSSSKYAMHGLLETIRVENLKKHVHVLIVAPGFTASNVRFSALTADGSQQGASPREEGKMMTADEAARRIVRAVAKRKRTLLMDFDGKATRILKFFAPGLLDKLYYNHMAKEPDSPLK
ncbi:MAG TPA: SDR family oxidoreductase [Candidatus Rikenella faecigallinarum]|uniref:SDR family oxidoreductase n=1 Tax=Candidatus Rikenella faecigallinarum TaxID=2838745 RepID=A0A9D1QDC9_9BACT|nr:SDR family oxidoreductase [Candidatus Rikenella faecigallinarum]